MVSNSSHLSSQFSSNQTKVKPWGSVKKKKKKTNQNSQSAGTYLFENKTIITHSVLTAFNLGALGFVD